MAKSNYSKEKELKNGSITFRMTQKDKDRLFEFCDKNSISVSMFIEKLILKELKVK